MRGETKGKINAFSSYFLNKLIKQSMNDLKTKQTPRMKDCLPGICEWLDLVRATFFKVLIIYRKLFCRRIRLVSFVGNEV